MKNNVLKNIVKKFKWVAGFTLIELLISMAIFIVFTGVLISSYTSIVRAQTDANEYRIMYVEARRIFEILGQELRDGMVDYVYYQDKEPSFEALCLISKDARVRTLISYEKVDEKGFVKLRKQFIKDDLKASADCVPEDPDKELVLNSEVSVKNFRIYPSPLKNDPYSQASVDILAVQFQPKVTVYAEFEKELLNGKLQVMDLQTTISSRIYNQIYSLESKNLQ